MFVATGIADRNPIRIVSVGVENSSFWVIEQPPRYWISVPLE